MSKITVEKYDGRLESFSLEKYRSALARSGLLPSEIDQVCDSIIPHLPSHISTKELYAQTFASLKKIRTPLACRYSLKRAIMELGPSGYPFEQYIAAIFTDLGYETIVGQTVTGQCITHEVDVIAKKAGEHLFIECKFHSKQHFRSRIKDPLYVKARFDDVRMGLAHHKEGSASCDSIMLVTNTKFSRDVLEYAPCAGIQLLSWNYPKGKSLAHLIDASNVHPLTCLSSITNAQKAALLQHDLVLCRDLAAEPAVLRQVISDRQKRLALIEEVKAFCIK